MARNCEKHFVGLNRVFLEEQWKRDRERKRPPLHTLTTAAEVRKWIPSIKKDIDYYLRQLSGARKHDYTESKFDEFEETVERLQKEHKRFVNKVFELDPSQQGIPWESKSYVSKRKLNSSSTSSEPTQPSSSGEVAKKKKKPIVLNILKKEKEENKEKKVDET